MEYKLMTSQNRLERKWPTYFLQFFYARRRYTWKTTDMICI